MTAVLIVAIAMLGSLLLALLIGACMDTGPDIHDGAAMRAQREDRYRQAREQENAAAAHFEKFGRGGV